MFPFYEETVSEKVLPASKTQWQKLKMQKLGYPSRKCIVREGHTTHRGSSGQGETTAALGLRGVFMEKVGHEAGS